MDLVNLATDLASNDAAEWQRRKGKPMPEGKYRLVHRAWWQGLLRGDIRPICEIPSLKEAHERYQNTRAG